MSTQAYGWTCPKCGTVHAPWQSSCPLCFTLKTSTGNTGGTYLYTGGAISAPLYSSYGTVFTSAGKSELVRAREVVHDWRAKGFGPKSLIVAAMDTLVDAREEDEDDDDE